MDTPPPGRMASRFVELREPRSAARRENFATLCCSAPVRPHAQLFRWCFRACYEQIRVASARHSAPGVAIIAMDDRGVAATAWVAAKVGEPNSAIIGRHLAADVLLADDATLSLRHLVLLTHPLRAGRDLRFRLLDLRTATAFTDERGQRLGALEAEGPAFVACGRYCLFLLPTGEELCWPDDPDTAWQCIPERIYLDEQAAEPDRWQRPRCVPNELLRQGRPRLTAVHTLASPVAAERALLAPGEEPIGTLEIRSPAGRDVVVLGRAAARAGVLLGRYERCDPAGLGVLGDPCISRVHCLIVEVDGELCAVDVASQNGLYALVPGLPGFPPLPHRIRLSSLRTGDELRLGPTPVVLRWRAAAPAGRAGGPRPPTVVSQAVH